MSGSTILPPIPKVRLFANPKRPASAAAGGVKQTGGFVADPGTDFTTGNTGEIAKRLDQLGKKLGVVFHGISGFRTPAHSVAVGGFADDPHTEGDAIDFGVNGSTRASAATITNAQLASVGLVRPFAGDAEINHVQLAGGNGGGGGLGAGVFTGPVRLGGTIAGAAGGATNAAVDAATAGAKAALDAVLSTVENTVGTWLLYAVLIFTGAALAVYGLIKLTGQEDKVREMAATYGQAARIAAVVAK